MAWITPVTNRENSRTRTTNADMNRIAGNINCIAPVTLKANYVVNDFVTLTEWTNIINATNIIADEIGMEHATESTRYDNLNYIELIAKTYNDVALYPYDDLYPANNLYPNTRRE